MWDCQRGLDLFLRLASSERQTIITLDAERLRQALARVRQAMEMKELSLEAVHKALNFSVHPLSLKTLKADPPPEGFEKKPGPSSPWSAPQITSNSTVLINNLRGWTLIDEERLCSLTISSFCT